MASFHLLEGQRLCCDVQDPASWGRSLGLAPRRLLYPLGEQWNHFIRAAVTEGLSVDWTEDGVGRPAGAGEDTAVGCRSPRVD